MGITRSIHIAVLLALLVAPATVFAQQPSSIPRPAGADTVANPAVDPTRNVLDLVAAAIQRQDDLRATQDRILILRSEAAERLNAVRFEQAKELSGAQDRRIDEIAKLRAELVDQLRVAESKRIDAIRTVDVQTTANTSQRTTEQATALALVVNQSAEVLRNQVSRAAEDTRGLVATTAATALQNQQQQFNTVLAQIATVSARITSLEQAGSESRGKQTFQDPAFAELLKEVRGLREARSTVVGVGEGRGEVIAYIMAALALLFSIIGGVTAVVVATRRKPENSRAR